MHRIGIGLRQLAPLVVLATFPAFAYQFPLSSSSIREAYFLGTSTFRTEGCVPAAYSRVLPQLTNGAYVSEARIETPYIQVAERACRAVNYTAQDADAEFRLDPPSTFRIQLDICFGYQESQAVRFRIIQNDMELAPKSAERSPYYKRERYGPPRVIGERVSLQFDADKIESTALSVEIETPAGQRATATFDLAKLR